jgi:hypothetical protein
MPLAAHARNLTLAALSCGGRNRLGLLFGLPNFSIPILARTLGLGGGLLCGERLGLDVQRVRLLRRRMPRHNLRFGFLASQRGCSAPQLQLLELADLALA